MDKTKIKPFISSVIRSRKVVKLLLPCHNVPLSFAVFVFRNVVGLDEEEHEYVPDTDSDENLVSSSIYMTKHILVSPLYVDLI